MPWRRPGHSVTILAPGETVILLRPPLPSVGVSTVMEEERQQNDSLVRGIRGHHGRWWLRRSTAGLHDSAAIGPARVACARSPHHHVSAGALGIGAPGHVFYVVVPAPVPEQTWGAKNHREGGVDGRTKEL